VIGSLRGTLLDRGADEVTVEVVGVGYRVTVSPTTAVSLGDLGTEIFCWVHHHQREDDVTLYGFATKDERRCFEALLGAHGVGPALALAILSIHTPVALARILAEDDLGALCLVPGVGKKTAARLLIDLKSRLSVPDLGGPALVPGASASTAGAPAARADVREALTELGYSEPEIREVMADLPPDGDAAGLLRDALQRLAAARR
jgi:holliday junction DNA helicase RuvA